VIKSKEFAVHNPQDNSKICDFSFEMNNHLVHNRFEYNHYLYFDIKSTPVLEDLYLEATVAIMDANVTEKLGIQKLNWKKYQKGEEIKPMTLSMMTWTNLEKRKGKFLAKNCALNIQCEVICELCEPFDGPSNWKKLKASEQ
jgi:hypothetical protein